MKVPREMLETEIRHCRILKCYKDPKKEKQRMKLTIALASAEQHWGSIETVMLAILVKFYAAEKKIGGPPRSGLEREAQRLLDIVEPNTRK